MVKKSKLRKENKEDNTLKKARTSQTVRQNVNVTVNLPEKKRRVRRSTGKGMRSRGTGEPVLPSSVTASNVPRRGNVEVVTTNRITQERLKEIQDEARSQENVKLLEAEKKVQLLQDDARKQQEQQEDRINQQTILFRQELSNLRTEGVDAIRSMIKESPLKKSGNIRGISTGRPRQTAEQRLSIGIKKFQDTGKIPRGRTKDEQDVIRMSATKTPLQTPQKNEAQGQAFDMDEEKSQDGN